LEKPNRFHRSVRPAFRGKLRRIDPKEIKTDKMNKLIALTLLSSVTVPAIFAQTTHDPMQCNNVAGVYLTSKEFRANSLTDSVCTDKKNNKLKMGFIGTINGHIGERIKLKEYGIKRTYNYRSVFGLLYNGNKYRLQKWVRGSYTVNGIFMVVDTSGLIIYSQKDPDIHNSIRYFYSNGIDGKIKSLRLKNFKKDFPDKDGFLGQVRTYHWKLMEKNEKGDLKINELWNRYAYKQ